MTYKISRVRLTAFLLALLAGCSSGDAADAPDSDVAFYGSAPAARVLPTGSSLVVTLDNGISSRDRSAGDAFTATLLYDVSADNGSVLLPAGSTVRGSITEVSPASDIGATGTLTLTVTSVTVAGESYDLDASIGSLETVEEGRGVEKADVARVAGGAAAGAILGRVIGGNTKGTVIGGASGAVAGAAVSVAVKDTDIVLPAGSRMTLTLRQPLTLAAR